MQTPELGESYPRQLSYHQGKPFINNYLLLVLLLHASLDMPYTLRTDSLNYGHEYSVEKARSKVLGMIFNGINY